MMTDNEIRDIIIDEFEKLSKMSVEEYTLYRKWQEIHFKEWDAYKLDLIYKCKENLWIPDAPEDYLKLQPKVILVDDKKLSDIWNTLRVMCSTAHWNANPGRNKRFIVSDEVTGRYLGIISIGSDFIAVGGRDRYIGWTTENKIKHGKLKHTAMGSSIIPTQPLGYNYMGGKLVALLTISNVVENAWNNTYKEKLAGITTTSLFNNSKGMSQYTRLKYWHKCDPTTGEVQIEPSDLTYKKIREWMKENYPTIIKKFDNVSHSKMRIVTFAMSNLKIKRYSSNFTRGVYFACLYDNTRDFLCNKTDKLGNKAFDNSVEAITTLWKERYAAPRLKRLLEDNRYNKNILYYDDIINLSWKETKEKYLDDVGR